MRSLLILGSGRSGTSMVAGLFRASGAWFGDEPVEAKRANPTGSYEDKAVNELNSVLITRLLVWRLTRWLPGPLLDPVHRDFRALWLAAPPVLLPRRVPAELRARMRAFLERVPFCLKDPRFNVTFELWRPSLPEGCRFLVVFRDPDRTAESVLRDAREAYAPPLPVTPDWVYRQWWRGYRRNLRRAASGDGWLFVHYDDVVSGAALPAIEAFAECRVDAAHVDPAVARASARLRVSRSSLRDRCFGLYAELRARAAADSLRWSS